MLFGAIGVKLAQTFCAVARTIAADHLKMDRDLAGQNLMFVGGRCTLNVQKIDPATARAHARWAEEKLAALEIH